MSGYLSEDELFVLAARQATWPDPGGFQQRHAATLRELWAIAEDVASAEPIAPDPRLSYEEVQLESGTVARARRVTGVE